jgi:uncharacterized protein YneR
MKVSALIAALQKLPQDLEVEVNNNHEGVVHTIDDVTHYVPNTDLWPDDVAAVVIQINVE